MRASMIRAWGCEACETDLRRRDAGAVFTRRERGALRGRGERADGDVNRYMDWGRRGEGGSGRAFAGGAACDLSCRFGGVDGGDVAVDGSMGWL